MIDVVLLTCERYDYTVRTVESFVARNAVDRFRLWHCDDASQDPRIRALASDCGFSPLVYTKHRAGVTTMIRRAASELLRRESEWMLLLENDWETVREFPWPAFDAIRSRGDVYTMRLYGTHKGRDGTTPAGTRHRGRGGADPMWQRFGDYEVGDIHWGNPPAVSKVGVVDWLFKGVSTERQAIDRSGLIGDKAARVVDNVVYHIGEARTPGFVS